MSKLTKRISALFLAIAFVFTFCMAGTSTVVKAADPTGTIIVQNNKADTNVSIAGKTYSAYKLLDLKQNEGKTTFAYTLATEFNGFFSDTIFTTAFPSAVVDEGKTSTIYSFISSLTTATDIEKFANTVNAYVEAKGISASATATAAATSGDMEKAEFSGLALGYYLIYGEGSSVDNAQNIVSACILDTTTYDAIADEYTLTIDVKVGVPTIDKVIVDENATDVKADSVSIGDKVDFKITSEVPDITGYTTYTFILTDNLSKGLDFNDDVTVKIGADTIAAGNYTVVPVTDAGTGITTVTITFTDFYNLVKNNYAAGTTITFTYSGTLNENAVVGETGNTNDAKITYSNDPSNNLSTADTTTVIVKVYTFNYNIFKYTGTDTPLAGAEFYLTKSGSLEKIAVVDNGDGSYRVATADEIADVGTVTTTTLVSTDAVGKKGYIYISGLGEGAYILTETKAPEGYNLLESPITVEIDPEYDTIDTTKYNNLATPALDATYTLLADKSGIQSDILNTSGTELPSTGGMGTTILYIIGGLLIILAIAGITFKKVSKKTE